MEKDDAGLETQASKNLEVQKNPEDPEKWVEKDSADLMTEAPKNLEVLYNWLHSRVFQNR